MADRHLPSPEVLRQLLRYEPETGKLFWRERGPEWFSPSGGPKARSAGSNAAIWNGKNAGQEAFTRLVGGYRKGSVFKATHRAHRVIWAMHYGVWPHGEVDHIDHDRQNNRIANLRVVTGHENSRNCERSRANRSGHTGVLWHARAKKWQAYIMTGRRQNYLGLHETLEDAVAARRKAEQMTGFHQNHGARLR